jgi:hypothetical protein
VCIIKRNQNIIYIFIYLYTHIMPTRRVGGRRGRKPVRIIGARLYCKCVSFSVVSLYRVGYFFMAHSVFRHINPSRQSPSHSANDSLSHLVQKFLTGPPLLRGPKSAFHRGPNPLSAALFLFVYICIYSR